MTSGEHTKGADLPLTLDGDIIVAPVVGVVARIPNHPDNAKNWQEYANLIVTAVNTYPAVAELVKALEDSRAAIASLQEYALGGAEVEHTDGSGPAYQYPIRDELLSNINSALTRFREAQAGGGA